MVLNNLYLTFKFLLPRSWQIMLRRTVIRRQQAFYRDVWPIDPMAGSPPEGWNGWPDNHKFALVLTHDVETGDGVDKCVPLAELEERAGFRSSFNFVAQDYEVPSNLRKSLTERGFEVGLHGLRHNKNPFRSPSSFGKQVPYINHYLQEWSAVGFRCPSMYHDLGLLHYLGIEYDASTFDTDPFEPQPDGMGTIFPFWVPNGSAETGYMELPYTLPQDFLLFILLQEKSPRIWQEKLDWIAAHNGMALFITHPNYMNFKGETHYEQYPAGYYEEFLNYIKEKYEGSYWNVLPRDLARYWVKSTDSVKSFMKTQVET